jgi:hypothetical protein
MKPFSTKPTTEQLEHVEKNFREVLERMPTAQAQCPLMPEHWNCDLVDEPTNTQTKE